MNKYQEALDRFEEAFRNITLDDDLTNERRDLIQELVDKETPKKPINQFETDFGLGNVGDCVCGAEVNYQQMYCSECGQKIDWSSENE